MNNATLELVDSVTALEEAIQRDDHERFIGLITDRPDSEEELVYLTEKALQGNALSIIQYLVTEKSAFILAAMQGDTATVEFLLKHGASVDHPDQDGQTALIWAAMQGNTATVALLLKHGASVDHPDQRGQTALIWAAMQGDTATVEFLLKHGASVDHPDQRGRTALIWAVERGHTATVALLIDRGADVHCADRFGKTALMRATEIGRMATVKFLVERGADVNHPDQDGQTALIWAAQEGETATVEFLLKHGACVDHPNNAHDTALALVIEARRETIDKLLVQAVMGADGNEEAQQAIDELLDAGASEEVHQVIDELFEQANAGEETRRRIVKLLLQASGLTYAGQETHQTVAQLLLQAGALSGTGQEDYLADWPAMREYRAALYDTLRPMLQKSFHSTDVSEDFLRFTLQAAPRMYAWKKRLLVIKSALEGMFGQADTLFYSRGFLLKVQLNTSPAHHADPLQLVKESIKDKTQFKSDVGDFKLENYELMHNLESFPTELFDKIVRMGQQDHLIDYLEPGLSKALRPYCRHILLLVNWVSNHDAPLETWFENSCPLDAPLQDSHPAHRSPQP